MKKASNPTQIKNELIKYTQFIGDPLEIPYDLRMGNVIQTCLDYSQP